MISPCERKTALYLAGLDKGKRIALGNVADLFDDLKAAYEQEHWFDMADFFIVLEQRFDELIRKTMSQK